MAYKVLEFEGWKRAKVRYTRRHNDSSLADFFKVALLWLARENLYAARDNCPLRLEKYFPVLRDLFLSRHAGHLYKEFFSSLSRGYSHPKLARPVEISSRPWMQARQPKESAPDWSLASGLYWRSVKTSLPTPEEARCSAVNEDKSGRSFPSQVYLRLAGKIIVTLNLFRSLLFCKNWLNRHFCMATTKLAIAPCTQQ